jgi:hypothetical protein
MYMRIGMALLGLVAVSGMLSCQMQQRPKPTTLQEQIAPVKVRTSDEIAPDLRAERDELLADAKARIHQGLIELAKRFPQLEGSIEWQRILKPLEGSPGWLEIRLYNYRPKKPPDPTPKRQRFRLTLDVRPPAPPGAKVPFKPLYPNLGLVGRIDIDAGDPELHSALHDLVNKALFPLKQLDQRSAEPVDRILKK